MQLTRLARKTAEQTQIRLVYQRSGLQGIVQPLARQAGFRNAIQFGIQGRYHRVQRRLVARPKAGQGSLEILGIAHPSLLEAIVTHDPVSRTAFPPARSDPCVDRAARGTKEKL